MPAKKRKGRKNPVKEIIKQVIDDVEALDLPDGAHWAMVHEQLGFEYGDVFKYIADDPGYFGFKKVQS